MTGFGIRTNAKVTGPVCYNQPMLCLLHSAGAWQHMTQSARSTHTAIPLFMFERRHKHKHCSSHWLYIVTTTVSIQCKCGGTHSHDCGCTAEGTTSTAQPVLSGKKGKAKDADLPVFCVSAKDCQRLEGRTSRDGAPVAFTKVDHTEIPQLRAHIHHLTGKWVLL